MRSVVEGDEEMRLEEAAIKLQSALRRLIATRRVKSFQVARRKVSDADLPQGVAELFAETTDLAPDISD